MPSEATREIVEAAAEVEQAQGERAYDYARGQAETATAAGDVAAAEKWRAIAAMLRDLHAINSPVRPLRRRSTNNPPDSA